MMRAGSAVGLRIAPVEISTVDVWEVLLDEFPVAVLYRADNAELSAVVLSHVAGGRVDTTFLSGKTKKTDSLSRKQVGQLLGRAKDVQYFIAEPSLSCEKITQSISRLKRGCFAFLNLILATSGLLGSLRSL
jgi:hypothetical protein